MRSILLIARRELGGYLRTMSGYVIIAMVLAVAGLLFNGLGLGGGDKRSSEVISTFFFVMSGVTMIASIFVSMRLLAEERQSGTLSLLYSSPVRDAEIVLGKYLSALLFLALMFACSLYMPLLVLVNGKVSVGHLAAGYLGLLLLGSACLAVGTFGSALAKNQVLASIISGCLVAALTVPWYLASITERPLSDIFSALALWQQHFPPFQSGLIHVRDVVYYVMVTYVALFGATRILEARRWK